MLKTLKCAGMEALTQLERFSENDPSASQAGRNLYDSIAMEPDWPELVREFRAAATAYWMLHPTNPQKTRFHDAYGEMLNALEDYDAR